MLKQRNNMHWPLAHSSLTATAQITTVSCRFLIPSLNIANTYVQASKHIHVHMYATIYNTWYGKNSFQW